MTSAILIYFDNKPIGLFRTNRIIELGIAVVPEGRRLFPKMTVLENLKLGAYFVRDQKDTAARLARVFNLFPVLEKRGDQTAGTLSGGEQSMLSIGRGIIGRPKILLLDEPSLGLAPRLVQEFFPTIGRVLFGTTGCAVEVLLSSLHFGLRLQTLTKRLGHVKEKKALAGRPSSPLKINNRSFL